MLSSNMQYMSHAVLHTLYYRLSHSVTDCHAIFSSFYCQPIFINYQFGGKNFNFVKIEISKALFHQWYKK